VGSSACISSSVNTFMTVPSARHQRVVVLHLLDLRHEISDEREE
jgi:hypothetical protein